MIKDIDIKILNGESNEIIEESEKLSLILDAIILSSIKPCNIYIYFKEVPNIEIFKIMDFQGSEYISLGSKVRDSKNEVFNYSFVRYIINNSLVVKVQSPLNNIINITFRGQNA